MTENLVLEYQWALIYQEQLYNITAQLNQCPPQTNGT